MDHQQSQRLCLLLSGRWMSLDAAGVELSKHGADCMVADATHVNVAKHCVPYMAHQHAKSRSEGSESEHETAKGRERSHYSQQYLLGSGRDIGGRRTCDEQRRIDRSP